MQERTQKQCLGEDRTKVQVQVLVENVSIIE